MGKTFIIAEMSCNHVQRKDIAIKTIVEAAKAGADAIKIQTLTPDTITLNCNKPDFIIGKSLWEGRTFIRCTYAQVRDIAIIDCSCDENQTFCLKMLSIRVKI